MLQRAARQRSLLPLGGVGKPAYVKNVPTIPSHLPKARLNPVLPKPQQLQHHRDPGGQLRRRIWALVPLCSKWGAGGRVTSTEPAASIKSLLPNPAHAHALFKIFTAVTGLFLSAHAEGPAPAGTMGVRGGVLHQPLIILKPSDMSEQARSRQFEG